MFITAENILSQLKNFSHYIETNIEDVDFDGEIDETDDPENPGFLKGWVHFLDVTTNTIISFSKEEMRIEVIIGDKTNCIIRTEQKIKRFLELQKLRSIEFDKINPQSFRL